jgi:hypothetical protein
LSDEEQLLVQKQQPQGHCLLEGRTLRAEVISRFACLAAFKTIINQAPPSLYIPQHRRFSRCYKGVAAALLTLAKRNNLELCH